MHIDLVSSENDVVAVAFVTLIIISYLFIFTRISSEQQAILLCECIQNIDKMYNWNEETSVFCKTQVM